MVENLPCHVHLRIDKRRDAKRNEAKKMAGRIRYAQPFPPYNLSSVFFNVYLRPLTVLKNPHPFA